VIQGTDYEKKIKELIDEVVDESGNVKIMHQKSFCYTNGLFRKRNELRKDSIKLSIASQAGLPGRY
jgi:hypothetical protein